MDLVDFRHARSRGERVFHAVRASDSASIERKMMSRPFVAPAIV
jgi:hypothetical protein